MKEKKYCPYCGKKTDKKFTEGRMRNYCSSCALVLYENPVPATCVVTVDSLDRVLLVKRNIEPKAGFWCLPGGFLENGETPEQGALRELMEETKIRGRIDMLLGVTTSKGTLYDTILMTGFLIRNYSGTPCPGDDAEDTGWFARDQMPEIAFNSHKSFIRIYYAAYRQQKVS